MRIGRLFSLFSSLRASLVLILSLSVVFLLGLWIPQKGVLPPPQYLQWKTSSPGLVSFLETAGMTDIYTSPLTLALWTLFFVNLALVMWKRAKVVRMLVAFDQRKLDDPVTTAGYAHKLSVPLSGKTGPELLTSVFAREKYKVYGGPERFYAVRNRRSPYATLLFHLSFFLVLLGGIVSVYTKFEGTVDLAEGEEFHGETGRYNEVIRLPKVGNPPGLAFTVEKIQPEMILGKPTGIRVTVRNAAGKRDVIEVNRPYEANGASLLIKDLGVAPLFVISDSGGKELDGAFVKRGASPNREETFRMAGLTIDAKFFPDYTLRKGIEVSPSAEVKNPAFGLSVRKGKAFVGRGTIFLGKSVKVGDYYISFPQLRYVVRFYVVKESGSGIVFAGLLIASLALAWRLLLFRREIVGSIVSGPDGAILRLAGRAEFYRALYEDEFLALAERVRGGLA